MDGKAFAILDALVIKDKLGKPVDGNFMIAYDLHMDSGLKAGIELEVFFEIIREMHIAGLVKLGEITRAQDIREDSGTIRLTEAGIARYLQEIYQKMKYI